MDKGAAVRKMTMEQALAWAYREELPKAQLSRRDGALAGQRGGWDGVAAYGAYLTLIDTSPRPENAYGLVPDFSATEGPHPDAIRIHEAVMALDDQPMTLPVGWYPLDDICDRAGEMGALGLDAVERALARIAPDIKDGKRVLRIKPAALIRKHAILGGTPEWQGEVPEIKPVLEYGKQKWFMRQQVMLTPADEVLGVEATYLEMEVDGYNKAAQRPYHGAYQKWRLEPDSVPVVEGRAEYELWYWSLNRLRGCLATCLQEISVAGVAALEKPWHP